MKQESNRSATLPPKVDVSGPALVYVYSGDKLPRYWRDSIATTRRGWRSRIFLLTDCRVSRPPKGVTVVDYRDWFDNEMFSHFSRLSPLDQHFRRGFWLKTVLRFFVIRGFMEAYSEKQIMHLELDVVGFSLGSLPRILNEFGVGAFIPWINPSHGIASMVYFNGVEGADEILQGFIEHSHLGHEMAMLGKTLENGSNVYGLPTSSTLARLLRGEPLPSNQLTPFRGLGLVDAAPIGHWVLGNDPRNQTGRLVRNHFIFDYNDDSGKDMQTVQPQVRRVGNSVILSSGDQEFNLWCLHIHSKALYLVRNTLFFDWVLQASRRNVSSILPVVPIIGRFRNSNVKRRLDIYLVRLAAMLRRKGG